MSFFVETRLIASLRGRLISDKVLKNKRLMILYIKIENGTVFNKAVFFFYF